MACSLLLDRAMPLLNFYLYDTDSNPNSRPFALAVVALLFYCVYYRLFVVRRPRVVCADAARLDSLKKHCPAFFEEFWPTVWAPQAHMQTIVRAAIQTFPKSERRRENLRLSDGGHVCLDWYNEVSDDQPTVLMLPGMTGSSDENYVRHWIRDMTEIGYRSVVFNYRGCGDSKLSTPKMYCCADISDLIQVVNHVHTTLPSSPLLAVGVSMAGNKAVFDKATEKGELYDKLMKCTNFHDLNLVLTMQMFGYKDWDHLIRDCSPHLRLEHINIPVLALNAADDPFCPVQANIVDAAEQNANLILVTTSRGGHFGFMEGLLPIFKTLTDRALVQFARAVLEHDFI